MGLPSTRLAGRRGLLATVEALQRVSATQLGLRSNWDNVNTGNRPATALPLAAATRPSPHSSCDRCSPCRKLQRAAESLCPPACRWLIAPMAVHFLPDGATLWLVASSRLPIPKHQAPGTHTLSRQNVFALRPTTGDPIRNFEASKRQTTSPRAFAASHG